MTIAEEILEALGQNGQQQYDYILKLLQDREKATRKECLKEFRNWISGEEIRINKGYIEKGRLVIPHIEGSLNNLKEEISKQLADLEKQ